MNNILVDIINKLYQKEEGIIAIRHYNNFCINADKLSLIKEDNTKVKIVHRDFCDARVSRPFDPFLQTINELCIKHELRIEEVLEKCQIYPLHCEIYESYFTSGIATRKEKPLINEINFEQQLFIEEIARMLEYFAQLEPICFLLENVSVAGYSTLWEIQKLMELSIKDISIICTFNETENEVEYTKELWQSLVTDWENNNILIDVMDEDQKPVEKANSYIIYPINELEDIYKDLCNLFTFMCYRQLAYHLNFVYHKFEVERITVSDEIKFKYFELYATTTMYMDLGAEAMLYLSRMQPLLKGLKDKMWRVRYNMVAASIYMYGFQQDIAQKYIDECRCLMDENDNPFTVFKISLIEHMNSFQGWRNVWMLDKTIPGLDVLISQCIKYGYDNHLAHIYVYAFDNEEERYANLANLNVKMPHFLKGMKIAKRIGNYNFMIEAYKKNVLLASTNGYYSTANYFNEKIRDICVEKNIRIELANTYNCMGYNYCVAEEYDKAYDCYNKALELFICMNDINSVNETVYNIAINALLAEQYQTAYKLFQLCIKGIDLINANSINVCNISKIYGLQAFCAYRLGQTYNAITNLQYSEQFLGHIIELEDQDVDAAHLWDDDLAIFYTVSALLNEQNGNLEEAYALLKKGKKFIDRAVGSRFMFFCPYAIIYARVAKSCGDDFGAKQMLDEAKKYCRQSNFVNRLEMVKAYEEGRRIEYDVKDFSLKKEVEDSIIYKAEYYGLAEDYNSQKKDLEFLSIWQKILSGNINDFEKVLDTAFVSLMNQYNLDDLIFIRMENGRPVLCYKNSSSEITEEILWYIVDYFNNNRSAFRTSRRDKGYTRYQKFINKCFGFNSICTFIAVPIFTDETLNSVFLASVQMNMEWSYKSKRYIYDNDDLSVFSMLYHNVVDFIERMEGQKLIANANNRLKNMAVKDQLTGIYNRQGLVELFNNDFDKCSVIYADLDNFKYYNDTFGHDVGDKVLIEFSKLLGSVTDQKADAVRYGGDEFLLILYTDDKVVVENAVKNIYDRLEKTKGLSVDISKSLGYELEIPKDKQLSCSIGIAMGNINSSENRKQQVDEILKKADTMMYRVKHTTKHSYMFYEY